MMMNEIDFEDRIYCVAEDSTAIEMQFPKEKEGYHYVLLFPHNDRIDRSLYQFQFILNDVAMSIIESQTCMERHHPSITFPKDQEGLVGNDKTWWAVPIRLPVENLQEKAWLRISKPIGNIEKDTFILARL